MKLKKDLIYNRASVEGEFSRINDMLKECDDNLKYLRELSLKSEHQDQYVGSYFSLNVADGNAYYQVQEYKDSADKYFVSRCKGICLDEYADSYIGDSRWVDGDYVRHKIQERKTMEKLFS